MKTIQKSTLVVGVVGHEKQVVDGGTERRQRAGTASRTADSRTDTARWRSRAPHRHPGCAPETRYRRPRCEPIKADTDRRHESAEQRSTGATHDQADEDTGDQPDAVDDRLRRRQGDEDRVGRASRARSRPRRRRRRPRPRRPRRRCRQCASRARGSGYGHEVLPSMAVSTTRRRPSLERDRCAGPTTISLLRPRDRPSRSVARVQRPAQAVRGDAGRVAADRQQRHEVADAARQSRRRSPPRTTRTRGRPVDEPHVAAGERRDRRGAGRSPARGRAARRRWRRAATISVAPASMAAASASSVSDASLSTRMPHDPRSGRLRGARRASGIGRVEVADEQVRPAPEPVERMRPAVGGDRRDRRRRASRASLGATSPDATITARIGPPSVNWEGRAAVRLHRLPSPA